MQLSIYPFNDQLEPEAIKFLETHLKPIQVPKGNLLFYQGDVCGDICANQRKSTSLYSSRRYRRDHPLHTPTR